MAAVDSSSSNLCSFNGGQGHEYQNEGELVRKADIFSPFFFNMKKPKHLKKDTYPVE